MHLKIVCLSDEVREMYKNHKTHHEGDSGLDLFIVKDEVLKPKSTTFVKLGIKAIALQYKSNYYYKCEKTENKKKDDETIQYSNSIGLIDAGYRGEIIAALDNTSDQEYHIKKNDKLVQLVSFTGEPLSFELVEELDETSRGEGGFGSTSNNKY
ncbi:dUTP pyrophosphatase, putative [Plasmodium sp. DRC-Itaito]|nr:dUTP pyrophosphatase, putative [Plasmodium sp. DRC-Itaito]